MNHRYLYLPLLAVLAACQPQTAAEQAAPTAAVEAAATEVPASAVEQYQQDEAEMAEAKHFADYTSADGEKIRVAFYQVYNKELQDEQLFVDVERNGVVTQFSKATETPEGNAVYGDGDKWTLTSDEGGAVVTLTSDTESIVFKM
ncbi:MAG: hypothetical protein Q4G42_03495 [Neisseria sp.]|nr:hypothetical protein [Neisseria sp.]